MELLAKISAFLEKYRWAITMSLFVCCIMQTCTISTLRHELAFMKNKYEEPANNQPLNESTDNAYIDENNYSNSVNDNNYSDSPSSVNTGWMSTVVILICIGLIVYLLWRYSKFPFCAWINGKIWQDFTGKIVYTLTINNRSRESVTVSNAIIEFINFKERRKFKMPVSDFPISLSKGTKHSVNISLQRLLEQHQELTSYKMIRVGVECNGKTRHTFPLGVKWQKA